ncbi:MAG: GtrA family protein [Ktedonobacterales bacterium]
MAKRLTEEDRVATGTSQPGARRGDTQPMPAAAARRIRDTQEYPASQSGTRLAGAPVRQVSYHPTQWLLVNTLLDRVETITHGRAGVLQRLFTYLLIGGTAALVNLGILKLLFVLGDKLYNLPLNDSNDLSLRYLPYFVLANVVAYELSILANFIPNDYFTFRHMPGHNRSWAARCLRFHITSLSGVVVTLIISGILHYGLKIDALLAQAIALILAVFYNFTVHHVFTYAHKKGA